MDKSGLNSLHLEGRVRRLVAVQLDRGGHPEAHVALLALQDHDRPVGQVEEEARVVLEQVHVGEEVAGLLGADELATVRLEGNRAIILPGELKWSLLWAADLTGLDPATRLDAEVPGRFEDSLFSWSSGCSKSLILHGGFSYGFFWVKSHIVS